MIIKTSCALAFTPLLLTACVTTGDAPPASKSGAAAPVMTSPATQTDTMPALPEPVVDSKAAATAILNTSYTIDGLILPTVRGQQLIQTRSDMRRTDAVMNFDNRLINAFAGDNRSADIIRLDKKLVWTLNPAKRTYKECPLAGCSTGTGNAPEKSKPEQKSKPSEPSCPLSLKKNELKVLATGEQKNINGFNTERIQLTWIVELEDKQSRRNSNRVQLDLWTTPENSQIRQVQALNESFQKRWMTALAVPEHPFSKYVPREVMGSFGGLMRGFSAKDARAFASWGGELKKVHGYPIAMNLSWTVSGNACGDDSNTANSATQRASLPPTSVSGAISSLLGGMVEDKVKETAKAAAAGGALLSYNYEVKTIDIKPVSDSGFSPDPAYQRAQ
ncbi:hypothetical protein [Undibacterium terreum]|uniref:DUF4412 domain-containing protein n=1 Tax=Undibacterium terreum TaxID=1224302 RepID=A0A916U6N1_9BURK|nr:hypothetical protein [Undibacterium terreum]GGC62351.1 hypothetical protein GCM10011396_06560 [Undibacterium terreum]